MIFFKFPHKKRKLCLKLRDSKQSRIFVEWKLSCNKNMSRKSRKIIPLYTYRVHGHEGRFFYRAKHKRPHFWKVVRRNFHNRNVLKPSGRHRAIKAFKKGVLYHGEDCNRGPKNYPPILEPAFLLVNRWPYMTYLLGCLPLAWSIACQLWTVAL